jgi:hypothetical protein
MSVEDRLKAEGIEVRSEKLSPASNSFLYGKVSGSLTQKLKATASS